MDRHTREPPPACGRWCARVLFLLLALVPAIPVEGQISGRVLDVSTRNPVPSANVALVDSAGNVWAQMVTDSTGSFSVIPMTNDAVFDIQVIAMGYVGAPVEPIRYTGQPVYRTIGVVAQPMELDGLTVEVEGQDLRLLLFGYYDRKDRGYGHFIDEEQIRASKVPGISGALRGTPGIRIRANRQVLMASGFPSGHPRGLVGEGGGFNPGARVANSGYCKPAVFVNGSPGFRFNDEAMNTFNELAGGVGFNDLLPPKDEVIGIEVYNSIASLPREMRIDLERVWRAPDGRFRVQHTGLSGTCGAILIWTRLDGETRTGGRDGPGSDPGLRPDTLSGG